MKLPQGFNYLPGFVRPEKAEHYFTQILASAHWQQQEIFLFGRPRLQPRLTAWYADPGIHYSYSGLALDPAPLLPALEDLRALLAAQLGLTFNSVLLNAYRNGQDSMGWHADDEPELGAEPVIASFSLGATRRMLIRPKAGGRSQVLELENGSLLLMQGRSQADWQHSIPKTRRPVEPRINLTFRQVRLD